MEFKSRYVNADEFRIYSGIDLAQSLGESTNPSDQVNAFIFRIETLLENWLIANFFIRMTNEYPKLKDSQKEFYKIALMEQMIYVLRNGDISTDSGYNMQNGKVATPEELRKITISRNTIDALTRAGLLTTKIRSTNGMFGRGFGNGWFF